ncbi:MAG: hypothetical protein U1F35_08815, partial [Steroidobacteraceae bacterium]
MNAASTIACSSDADEDLIAAALARAKDTGRPALDVLEETSGLGPAELAAVLGRLFDYRCIGSTDLNTLEPAFNLLSSAECTRRNCVLVNGIDGLVAVIADPFDNDLRAWLEVRISATLQWSIAARADIRAYLSRHEAGLRAIDSAVEAAQSDAGLDGEMENLSLASINQDSSPIVKL